MKIILSLDAEREEYTNSSPSCPVITLEARSRNKLTGLKRKSKSRITKSRTSNVRVRGEQKLSRAQSQLSRSYWFCVAIQYFRVSYLAERALTYFILYRCIIFNNTFWTYHILYLSSTMVLKIAFICDWSAMFLLKTTSAVRFKKKWKQKIYRGFCRLVQFLKVHQPYLVLSSSIHSQ